MGDLSAILRALASLTRHSTAADIEARLGVIRSRRAALRKVEPSWARSTKPIRVVVRDLYGGRDRVFVGLPRDVEKQILAAYRYLNCYWPGELFWMLQYLNSQQAHEVSVRNAEDVAVANE